MKMSSVTRTTNKENSPQIQGNGASSLLKAENCLKKMSSVTILKEKEKNQADTLDTSEVREEDRDHELNGVPEIRQRQE